MAQSLKMPPGAEAEPYEPGKLTRFIDPNREPKTNPVTDTTATHHEQALAVTRDESDLPKPMGPKTEEQTRVEEQPLREELNHFERLVSQTVHDVNNKLTIIQTWTSMMHQMVEEIHMDVLTIILGEIDGWCRKLSLLGREFSHEVHTFNNTRPINQSKLTILKNAIGLTFRTYSEYVNNLRTRIFVTGAQIESQKRELESSDLWSDLSEGIQNLKTSIGDMKTILSDFYECLKGHDAEPKLINAYTLLVGRKNMLASLIEQKEGTQYVLPDASRVENLEINPTIHANPNELLRTVENLVINARHAVMPKKGKIIVDVDEVEVAGHGEIPDGTYVAISVEDNGTGMDEATLGKIFTQGFTTRGNQGNGIGLTQVFDFARKNNGCISIITELGKGSTFTIYLPKQPRLTVAASDGKTRE
ncbi:MAG: ATP-binding protein [Patescibacteria group bacterium]